VVSAGTGGEWGTAQAAARSTAATWVTVNDSTEEQWLRTTFGGSVRVWIGLSDAANEGTWTWANGESAAFLHWAGGEPNNTAITGAPGVGEDFAAMNWNTSTGAWNDWDHRNSIYTHNDGIVEADFNRSTDAFGGSDVTMNIGTILGTDEDDTLIGPGLLKRLPQ
jgi:hypothetical protein